MSLTKEIISKALHLKPSEKSIVIEALMDRLDVPDSDLVILNDFGFIPRY